MALDTLAICDNASTGEFPGLAVFLTVLFSVYIAIDSLIAASVIVRKTADAASASKLGVGL